MIDRNPLQASTTCSVLSGKCRTLPSLKTGISKAIAIRVLVFETNNCNGMVEADKICEGIGTMRKRKKRGKMSNLTTSNPKRLQTSATIVTIKDKEAKVEIFPKKANTYNNNENISKPTPAFDKDTGIAWSFSLFTHIR